MRKRKLTDKKAVAELKLLNTQSQGVLHPRVVVDAARKKTSSLHKYFEWNDSKAAEEYRVWQARELISVAVEIIETKDGKRNMQVFCSLSQDRRDGGYRTFCDVMSDKDMRFQLLQDAAREMERFESRYHDLRELSAVFTAMRRSRRKVAA